MWPGIRPATGWMPKRTVLPWSRRYLVISKTDAVSSDYRNVISLKGATTTGAIHSVSGTLTGPKQIAKLTEVEGYDVEVALAEHHVVFSYTDRPGIVAASRMGQCASSRARGG